MTDDLEAARNEAKTAQAGQELRELLDRVQAKSGYASEEEAMTDAEAAVREVREEMRQERHTRDQHDV